MENNQSVEQFCRNNTQTPVFIKAKYKTVYV